MDVLAVDWYLGLFFFAMGLLVSPWWLAGLVVMAIMTILAEWEEVH